MFLFNPTEVKKEELKVELSAPVNSEPGSEVIIKLKITGGDVKGFAKYTDRLPEGCTAKSVNLGDATFTADNGQVKIIWLEFPKEAEVIIEYSMSIPKSRTQNIDLGGKFSYLDNNEKRVFSVFKKQITVGSNDVLAKAPVKEETLKEVSVNVMRRVVNSKENIHQIEVSVVHSGIDGFGKIEEYVPLGAVIEKGEVENAAFSSIKNKVKFVWMSFPQEKSFVITYYVDLSKAESKDINSLTGKFSYLDNEVSKKVDINFGSGDVLLASKEIEKPNSEEAQNNEDDNSQEKTDNSSLAEKNTETTPESKTEPKDAPEEKIAIVTPVLAAAAVASGDENKESEKENPDESAEITAVSKIEDQPTESTAKKEESSEEKQDEELAVVEEMNNPVVEKNNEIEEEVSEDKDEIIEEKQVVEEPVVAAKPKVKPARITNPPLVVSGVNYRVQIAAGANVVDATYFKSRHNFESEFKIENHQGWVKYTTGAYAMYKDARDSRESINGQGYNFDGPFVTAYNDGTRITVQEALMISSQKWYK